MRFDINYNIRDDYENDVKLRYILGFMFSPLSFALYKRDPHLLYLIREKINFFENGMGLNGRWLTPITKTKNNVDQTAAHTDVLCPVVETIVHIALPFKSHVDMCVWVIMSVDEIVPASNNRRIYMSNNTEIRVNCTTGVIEINGEVIQPSLQLSDYLSNFSVDGRLGKIQ